MQKIFKEFLNFASHNTGFIVTQLVIIAILIWTQGCESQTRSILDPTKTITRGQLNIEVDTFVALADLRYSDLDKQDQFKRTFLEHAVLWSTTGAINPVGLVTALAAIAGIGATVDNVTKRRKEGKTTKAYVKKLEELNGE